MKMSVIICTHNPKSEYLRRTFDALEGQTLPKNFWELIVIDNASDVLLSESWDISSHPNARHVRENQIGLTAARLRGIRESIGDLILFVDDDNVLESDYLERAVEISNGWWMLGAWGGRIDPEYEVSPPEWALPHVSMLALRPVIHDVWSNDPTHLDALPWGAGMCVRRSVALRYVEMVENDPVRMALDRTGNSLGSCGDLDLAQTSSELGLGFGLFSSLKLLHLIPKARLEEGYLLRIHEGSTTTLVILNAVRGLSPPPELPSLARRIIDWGRSLRMNRLDRLMWQARQRAYQSAREVCLKHDLPSGESRTSCTLPTRPP